MESSIITKPRPAVRRGVWNWRPYWNGIENLLYRSVLLFLALVTLLVILYLKSRSSIALVGDPLLFVYTVGITLFQLSRLLSAILYRRTNHQYLAVSDSPGEAAFEPPVTFVIPCKNEEDAIAGTVTKCFDAHYPKEKLEVIVINDGSTDRTIEVLRELEKKQPRLAVVDWKENRGKRHGMAEGIRRATGEIIIQLDSDSHISPETFRNLVRPFRNPEVGAVCAHADPANAEKNWLTRMQAAYYFVSFRILKAAESAFMTVFCCSGCSSAYRREIILPILDRWLDEKFLGLPVTWGEDRALTNWVLRLNYRTIYSEEVRAHTICPDSFRKFLKQQIRWKKGWLVNSIFASMFIVRREPFVAFTYFFPLLIISLITPFIAVKSLILGPILRGALPLYYISGVFLMSFVMTLYYRWLSRENKYWPFVFVWSAINMVFLSFVLFYSIATIQNRKWGTR
ncbi:MAG: glycosyltransferase family 2 protein [Anaerolineales bacterium]|nr:glycosyltransferase family 2 protein [Anaerolineales bacterium]